MPWKLTVENEGLGLGAIEIAGGQDFDAVRGVLVDELAALADEQNIDLHDEIEIVRGWHDKSGIVWYLNLSGKDLGRYILREAPCT